MRCLVVNNLNYCIYPEGIHCTDDFMNYLNKNFLSFIKLKALKEENCVAPYFIKEEYEDFYINVQMIHNFFEGEAIILSREEYDKRLKTVINQYCVHCFHYENKICKENLEVPNSVISLDGKCYSFEKKN